MLDETTQDYSKFLEIDLAKKLEPIRNCIDQMSLRLDEFEAMITVVQQERCNAIGITGSLTEVIDYKAQLEDLCKKIEKVESLIEHIDSNITTLEHKMDIAEAKYGPKDSTAKLKNFFMPLFKKNDVKANVVEERELFKTEDYFIPLDYDLKE